MSKEKSLHKGVAIGGPFDGKQLESRFPSGVVVVSSPDGLAWIYDGVTGGDERVTYVCRGREAANGGALRLDQSKLGKAADGNTYDVRAVDDAEVTEEVGM